jgi:hypothetical protein
MADIRSISEHAAVSASSRLGNAADKGADLASSVAGVVNNAGEKFQDAVKGASDVIENLPANASDFSDAVQQKSGKFKDAVVAEIRLNPIRSVALAASIAFLYGFSRNR